MKFQGIHVETDKNLTGQLLEEDDDDDEEEEEESVQFFFWFLGQSN